MAFEDLRRRLEQLLADASRTADPRGSAGGMHDAMVETRVALDGARAGIERTTRELEGERRQLADAERRGQLARDAGDLETVEVASRFIARHTERIGVLERRLAVQHEELALLERDYAELSATYTRMRRGIPPTPQPRVTDEDLGLEGGPTDAEFETLRRQASREELDAAVQAQLAALKAKMGKGG